MRPVWNIPFIIKNFEKRLINRLRTFLENQSRPEEQLSQEQIEANALAFSYYCIYELNQVLYPTLVIQMKNNESNDKQSHFRKTADSHFNVREEDMDEWKTIAMTYRTMMSNVLKQVPLTGQTLLSFIHCQHNFVGVRPILQEIYQDSNTLLRPSHCSIFSSSKSEFSILSKQQLHHYMLKWNIDIDSKTLAIHELDNKSYVLMLDEVLSDKIYRLENTSLILKLLDIDKRKILDKNDLNHISDLITVHTQEDFEICIDRFEEKISNNKSTCLSNYRQYAQSQFVSVSQCPHSLMTRR